MITKIVFISLSAVPDSAVGHIESALSVVMRQLPEATTWLVVGSLYGGSRVFAFLTWAATDLGRPDFL